MIVTCPKCERKFRVPDEQVQSKGIKVRCGRCRTVFGVRRAIQDGEEIPRGEWSIPDQTASEMPGERAAPYLEAGPFQPFIPVAASEPYQAADPLRTARSVKAAEPVRAAEIVQAREGGPPARTFQATEPARGIEPARTDEPSPFQDDHYPDLGDLDWQRALEGAPGDEEPPMRPAVSHRELPEFRPSTSGLSFPAPVSDAYAMVSQAPDTLARWLASAVVALLVILGFLLFVAYRNDGFLDLKELDQMVAAAFKGQTYRPRFVETIRVLHLDDEIVEQPALDDPGVQRCPLVLTDMHQSMLRTRNDVQLTLIEGDVLNPSNESYRRIIVEGSLLDSDRLVARQTAPVGGTLSSENLENVLALVALEDLYENLRAEVVGLVIEPNQISRFTLVFIEPEGFERSESWDYQVSIVQAEHAGEDGIWRMTIQGQHPHPTQ